MAISIDMGVLHICIGRRAKFGNGELKPFVLCAGCKAEAYRLPTTVVMRHLGYKKCDAGDCRGVPVPTEQLFCCNCKRWRATEYPPDPANGKTFVCDDCRDEGAGDGD